MRDKSGYHQKSAWSEIDESLFLWLTDGIHIWKMSFLATSAKLSEELNIEYSAKALRTDSFPNKSELQSRRKGDDTFLQKVPGDFEEVLYLRKIECQ